MLGGAVTELGTYDWGAFQNIYADYRKGDSVRWGITQIRKKGLRLGAALAAQVAHDISKGAETLALRMERQCSNAQALAEFYSSSRLVVWRLSIIQATSASPVSAQPGLIWSLWRHSQF